MVYVLQTLSNTCFIWLPEHQRSTLNQRNTNVVIKPAGTQRLSTRKSCREQLDKGAPPAKSTKAAVVRPGAKQYPVTSCWLLPTRARADPAEAKARREQVTGCMLLVL